MSEGTRVVTLHGNPVTLLGNALGVGDAAPDFTLLDGGLQPVRLGHFQGKTKLISVVPSLDRPVCELQTLRFHAAAEKLPDSAAVLVVSMDLLFAQGRFCATHGIEKLNVLSDFNSGAFGLAYGVLLEDLRLLARAVFVIGPDDFIRYVEIVSEIANHPDYDAALAQVALP